MLRRLLAIPLIGVVIGCSSEAVAPRPLPDESATKFWDVGATVRWNTIAREETRSGVLNVFTGARMLTYLSLAQYNAAVAALKANDRGEHPSIAAAVGGASVALLSAAPFFPARAAFFEAQLDAQEAGPRWPGEAHRDFAAGEALGRQIAAAVLASAATDGFTPSNAGVTVPVCPGCWFSAPGLLPAFPRLGEMRPFFLTSGSQFRPPAPPAFGSPALLAALAEVRQVSDTRTPEQDASAKFWARPNGFAVIPANNYQVATELIVQHHLSEVRAAHTLALMGMASMDAFIACHDAKYTYWLFRPSQADPGITLSVPLPNFPSYPSNHACVSGASMAVLASLFPSEASRLNGLADEAALSRLLGGIHYRFDNNTGLVLGRRVAAWALAHDVSGHAAYALQ
ncbi:MAG TPA: vanadium-dependent haloperoxidase [Gemmatimonadales bacterium]|nr:vanadium-dependent haloperoxidase [Gemmatimonadales bacterium]